MTTFNERDEFDELYALDGSTPSYLRVRGASGTPSDGNVEIWVAANGRKEWGPMTGSGGLSDGDYGDIVVSGSGTVMTIDTNVVSDAKLRQGAACTVIGRSANSTGNVADIALNADGKFLVRRSGALTGDTLVAGDIPSLDASKITTGTLALARGGTNADLSASGGTTKILAQDASHVISARDLVAADIPSLDASKITTGTLAVAQGGTNIGSYTTGDLLYASSGTALSKLAIGGTNKVLTVAAGLPAWVDVTGSGGGGVLPSWVAYAADTPPATAQTEDDEFDSSSLAGKWTSTSTSGSPTVDVDTTIRSHYVMKSTATSSQVQLLTQAFSATAFTIAARIKMPYSANAALIRLFISDGTALTNAVSCIINGNGTLTFQKRVAGTPTTLGTFALTVAWSDVILYLQKTAANTWKAALSDGLGECPSGFNTQTVTFTETTIGLQLSNGAGFVGDLFAVDWFRRDWKTYY